MAEDREMESDKGRITNPQSDAATPAGAKAPGRRGFLAGAGAAAGVAGAAVLAVKRGAAPAAEAVAADAAPAKPVGGLGYHETAHIRKYYDTTKV